MKNNAGSSLIFACGLACLAAVGLLQFFPSQLSFGFPLLAAVVLAIAGIVVGIRRELLQLSIAGLFSLATVLVLCGWIWGTQFALYPDDPVRGCVEALGPDGVGSGILFHKSVLPPGLFCLADVSSGWVLVTNPGDVVGWSTVLGVIVLALIGAGLLARRGENRVSS